jgi:outer membrane protein TolC
MARRLFADLAIVAVVLFFSISFPESAYPDDGAKRLTVNDCVSIALKKNITLLMAHERKSYAENRRKEALGVALPDVSLSGSYLYQGNVAKFEMGEGKSLSFMPDHNYSMDLSVSQWIYSSAVSAGYEAARLLEKAASEGYESARLNVATAVKLKFYGAMFARDVVSSASEAVERASSHAKDARERKAVGLGTDYDVKRLETSLAEAGANLSSARNEYAKAVADLVDTLALDPMTGVELAGELAYDPLEIPLASAVESARQKRPDLGAARNNYEAAKNITNAFRSELTPSARAFGGLKRSNTEFQSDGGFGWRSDWNVGVKVDMNLYDGGERSSRVRQRFSEEEIARLESENAERQAVLEVKTAHDDISRAGESVLAQMKNMEYAQETYRIVSERRKLGMATHLELLDAHAALTGAGVNHSKALFEHMAAKTKLLRAMGVLDMGEK